MREEKVVSTLRDQWPELRAVYIFGSFAKGNERTGSDLDVAALGKSVVGLPTTIGLVLSLQLGIDVDLVDLGYASTVLQKEVIKDGRLLWSSDPFETEMFELRVWSMYQKLCDERAEIIADGLATGRFYHS